ncbi:MAG: hypothetical protein AB1449_07000 [Chloroflexota bacterium]
MNGDRRGSDSAERCPIPDLYIRPFSPQQAPGLTRWTALRNTDPLLRRFGLAEVLRRTPEARAYLRLRTAADEVWVLLEGQVEFLWHDLRTRSPSFGIRHHLQADRPLLVLAPFGVAFGVRAQNGAALLLRLATHSDEDPDASGDQELPWPSED